jgi:hypothetical protein
VAPSTPNTKLLSSLLLKELSEYIVDHWQCLKWMQPLINRVVPKPLSEVSPKPYKAVVVAVGRTTRLGGFIWAEKILHSCHIVCHQSWYWSSMKRRLKRIGAAIGEFASR